MGIIDKLIPASGRLRKENGEVINQADIMVNQADIIANQANVISNQNDPLTGGQKVINTDHYYIHKGIGYKAYIELATVGATPVEYSFVAPFGTFVHLKNMQLVALGGTLKVTIKRGTLASPLSINSAGVESGDVTGPNSLNDNVNRPTGVVVRKTPSYHDAETGEDWFKMQVVGDTTNQFTSVAEISSSENEEIVMQPETYYVIRFERIGSDSPASVMLTMFWYEEPQGLV